MKLKFENGYAEGFVMAVPESFRSAFERERFDRGDTFYDTKRAYEGTWTEGISHLSFGLQVTDCSGDYIEFMVIRPKGTPPKLECSKKVRELVPTFISYLKNGYMSDD
jgi:hypothetical protein